MRKKTAGGIFESYCYGPADLVGVRRGESTMWLLLRDPAGRMARAVYRGCVYWRMGRTGTHLSLVQRVTAAQLLERSGSPSLTALEKNTSDVARLLREWEEGGLSFYLHLCGFPEMEFLVVARSLDYEERS